MKNNELTKKVVLVCVMLIVLINTISAQEKFWTIRPVHTNFEASMYRYTNKKTKFSDGMECAMAINNHVDAYRLPDKILQVALTHLQMYNVFWKDKLAIDGIGYNAIMSDPKGLLQTYYELASYVEALFECHCYETYRDANGEITYSRTASNYEFKNDPAVQLTAQLGTGLVSAIGESGNYADNAAEIKQKIRQKRNKNLESIINTGGNVAVPDKIRQNKKKKKNKKSATVTKKNILRTSHSFWETDKYQRTDIKVILPTVDNQNNHQQDGIDINNSDGGNIAEQGDIITENNNYINDNSSNSNHNDTPHNDTSLSNSSQNNIPLSNSSQNDIPLSNSNQNDTPQSMANSNSQISGQNRYIPSYTGLNGNLKNDVVEDINNNSKANDVINQTPVGGTFYHIKGEKGGAEYKPKIDGVDENDVNEEGELFIIEIKQPNGDTYIHEEYFQNEKDAKGKCDELRNVEYRKILQNSNLGSIDVSSIDGTNFQNKKPKKGDVYKGNIYDEVSNAVRNTKIKFSSTYNPIEYEIKTVTPIKKTVSPPPVQNNLQRQAGAQQPPAQHKKKEKEKVEDKNIQQDGTASTTNKSDEK